MTFKNDELVGQMDHLHRFAYKLCRNDSDADDLLQATALKVLENREKFQTGTNFYGWASKIMFNTFASQYRRKVKFESRYDPDGLIEAQAAEATQDVITDLRRVDMAMERLTEDHRRALTLVVAQGHSYKEAGEILGVPVGTVRSRLSRARGELDVILGTGNYVSGFVSATSH